MDFASTNVRLNASTRANIGLGCARSHTNAHADARDVGARAGDDLALFDKIVDLIGLENGEIERLTNLDLTLQGRAELKLDREFVTGRAFEPVTKLVNHGPDREAAQDIYFSRFYRDALRQHNQRPDSCGGNKGTHLHRVFLAIVGLTTSVSGAPLRCQQSRTTLIGASAAR